jgi:hypothetical protein
MTTISNLAALIAGESSSGDLRFRQAVITAVASDGTCTIKISGDDVEISEVSVAAHVCPVPGATCWIATDGTDLYVQSTLAPNGPAWGNMQKITAQSIANSTFVAVNWLTSSDRAQEYNYGTVNTATGIQVLVPGLWAIDASPGYTSASASGIRGSSLTVNGTAVWRGATGVATGTILNVVPIAATLKLAIGDVVNFEMYQSSGAALNTNSNSGGMILNVRWVGPTPV